MLTFFSIAKPFEGHIGEIQRRAIESWRAIDGAEVLLYGEDGLPVARNAHGTPLLSDAFAQADRDARHDVLCFVNADIVFGDDVTAAVRRVHARPFLIVGECWSSTTGRKRGADHLDYFVFSRGLYAGMPPFAIGRTAFDNWLVWKARDAGATVVDATPVVHPIHQDHDYGHFAGGLDGIRAGAEAAANRELVGGKDHLYSRYDATHVLTPSGLRRNLGAAFHSKERARRAVWKLRHTVLR